MALEGGAKEFSTDWYLLKLTMLLSEDSVNQLQLRLSLMDVACKLGKFSALFKEWLFLEKRCTNTL